MITTEACRHYLQHGRVPDELRVHVMMPVRHPEDAVSRATRRLQPSGARSSMPAMMETGIQRSGQDLERSGVPS